MRFNELTTAIKLSLESLRRAIAGQIVMTKEVEELQQSLLLGRVPALWKQKSYPSLKLLGSYISDLLLR